MCNHLSYIYEKQWLTVFLTHIQKVKTHCVGLHLTIIAENHASTYCDKSYRLHNWYNWPSKPCTITHPHACFSLRKSRKSQTVRTALAFTAKSSSAALLHSKVLICSLFKFTDLWNSGSWTSCKANHNTCFQSCGFTVIGSTSSCKMMLKNLSVSFPPKCLVVVLWSRQFRKLTSLHPTHTYDKHMSLQTNCAQFHVVGNMFISGFVSEGLLRLEASCRVASQ